MALTTCKECSAEISDSAATCPRCGVASPGGSCSILLSRAKNLAGRLHPCEVYLDGVLRAELVPGGSIGIETGAGAFHLDVVMTLPTMTKSLTDTLNLLPKQEARYEIRYGSWGGYKLVRVA